MKRRTRIPQAELEIDNILLRKQYLAQHETYTGREIREASGQRAGTPSEPASRWKNQGRIFGVPADRADRYPAFQFVDGRPRPEIAKVLAALGVRRRRLSRGVLGSGPLVCCSGVPNGGDRFQFGLVICW